MPTIPRKLPNASLAEWSAKKPTAYMARTHMERVIRCAPAGWQVAVSERLAPAVWPLMDAHRTDREWLEQPPEWARAWDMLQAVADYEDRFGAASLWDLDDADICAMAKKLAGEADELDALALGQGAALADRVDSIRLLVRCVGIAEDKPITGLPAILRAQDAAWWRRRLRVHVARVVEAGSINLGRVNVAHSGYVSREGLQRRQAQLKRNAQALARTLYRNEAGQVYTLHELAALGTANPIVRGGELMTRIRGAEEYADARGHVGLFLTLTLPSRFHRVKLGSGGRPVPNKKYGGATPRDGQLWLRDMWAKTRAALARRSVKMYGLRVAEPHHDATPHWHALIWAESEAGALEIEKQVRRYWMSDDGAERGAAENRINVKRMVKGGAAGYVAKYIAKSVGHLALAEHQDVVDGQQIAMDFGTADPKNLQEAGAGRWPLLRLTTATRVSPSGSSGSANCALCQRPGRSRISPTDTGLPCSLVSTKSPISTRWALARCSTSRALSRVMPRRLARPGACCAAQRSRCAAHWPASCWRAAFLSAWACLCVSASCGISARSNRASGSPKMRGAACGRCRLLPSKGGAQKSRRSGCHTLASIRVRSSAWPARPTSNQPWPAAHSSCASALPASGMREASRTGM